MKKGETRQILSETLLVLTVALLAATLCAFFHPQRPAWHQAQGEEEKLWSIDEARARQLMAAGRVQWIDARKSAQFEAAHLPGAISLDLDRWSDLMFSQQGVMEKAMGNPLIVYCDGGRCERSRDVAQKLREIGFHPVYLFKGKWQNLASDGNR